MDLRQAIECNGGAGSTLQLFFRAIRLNVEGCTEFGDTLLYVYVAHLPAQGCELINL